MLYLVFKIQDFPSELILTRHRRGKWYVVTDNDNYGSNRHSFFASIHSVLPGLKFLLQRDTWLTAKTESLWLDGQ